LAGECIDKVSPRQREGASPNSFYILFAINSGLLGDLAITSVRD
jgi:hypothetical protein